MDKAAIFAELTQRNAVRRGAQLPLLDMRAEFDHAVAVAAWREACDRHVSDIPRIQEEVLAEMRATRGAHFPQSVGGHWLVNIKVNQRFCDLLAAEGVHMPSSRHAVVYGSDKDSGTEG